MYPFIGEIKLFAGDLAPSDWAFATGRRCRLGKISRCIQSSKYLWRPARYSL